MQLKSMSLDKLVVLKTQVEAALTAKVVDQRRMLQQGLTKLSRFQDGVRLKAIFVLHPERCLEERSIGCGD